MNRQQIIEEYAKAGYALFKCQRTPDGKKIPSKNWRKSVNDPNIDPAMLGDIFGLNLGPQDLVIDVDVRRFVNGENQIRKLFKQLKITMPKTLQVQTGDKQGGWHFYLKLPPGVKIRQSLPGFEAIEFKTEGRYIIGAGSLHPSGKHYEIIDGSIDDIQECPPELVEILRSDELSGGVLEHDGIWSDDDAAINQFKSYCSTAPAAISGMGGDEQTYKVALAGRDFGLSEQSVLEIMDEQYNPKCSPEWSYSDLAAKVSNAFNYAKGVAGSRNPSVIFADVEPHSDAEREELEILGESNQKLLDSDQPTFTKDRDGKPRPTISNAQSYFLIKPTERFPNPLYGLVRFNQFTKKIELTRPAPWHNFEGSNLAWQESDTTQLESFLSRVKKFDPGANILFKAVQCEAYRHSYHPIKDYLNGLKWDKIPRLESFLVDFVGAPDTLYVREIAKATLIGAVSRIFQPGCKHDSMLVLEGNQGNAKSEVVKVLGGQWYGTFPIITKNKDTIQNMQGVWFIEAAEMEFMKREQAQAFKAYLTTTTDIVRFPYERLNSTVPRAGIFVGTVNPDNTGEYLNDSTGNRRFWPVATTTVDIDGLKEARDQLFAEAVYLYKKGGLNYLKDSAAIEEALIEQEKRAPKEIWGEVIGSWLRRTSAMQPEELTTEYIASSGLNIPVSQMNRLTTIRINKAMHDLDYKQHLKREGDHRYRVWRKDNLGDL